MPAQPTATQTAGDQPAGSGFAGLTPPTAAAQLDQLSPDTAVAALRRHARQEGEAAYRLLEALAGMGNHPRAQLAAVEALGEVPVQAAADLADRWTAETAPKELRKAARRALLRLAQRGIHPVARGIPASQDAPADRPERVRLAVMSAVNGEGTRLLYLLFDVPLSGAYMAMAVVSQAHGLTRFESATSSGRQFERTIGEDSRRYGFTLVDVAPAYARHLLAEAVVASRAAGRGLPQHYHSFRELLAVDAPEAEEMRSPVYELPDADAVRYRSESPEESVQLLDRMEFADWLPAQERVLPLAEEWESAEGGTLALPPSAVAQRRDAIMERLVELVLGSGGAAGFRRRLEDNAYVLLKQGGGHEARDGRRALAAALALDPPTEAVARLHPLVRSMAARALDEARTALAERAERMNPYGIMAPPGAIAPQPPAAPEEAPAPRPDEEREPSLPKRAITAGGLTTTPSGLILPR